MKKLLAAILSVSLLLSSCGKTADDTNTADEAAEEFIFGEAVKDIKLFGETLSLPCTADSLSECFTLEDDSDWGVSSGASKAELFYNGEKIGSIELSGKGQENITSLELGFGITDSSSNEEMRKTIYRSYGWYSETIEAELGGINFYSTRDDITRIMGEPTENTESYRKEQLLYKYPEGSVSFDLTDGKIQKFEIKLGHI